MNPQKGRTQNRDARQKSQTPKHAPNGRNGHPRAAAPVDTALNPANPLRQIIQKEALRALRSNSMGVPCETASVSVEISHFLETSIGSRALQLGVPEAQAYSAALLLGWECLCAQDLFHRPFMNEVAEPPLPKLPADHFEDWPKLAPDDWEKILQDREELVRELDEWDDALREMPYRKAIAAIGKMYELLRCNPYARNVALALRFIHEANDWMLDLFTASNLVDEDRRETIKAQSSIALAEKSLALNGSGRPATAPSCAPNGIA